MYQSSNMYISTIGHLCAITSLKWYHWNKATIKEQTGNL